jgi:hypothetical protein
MAAQVQLRLALGVVVPSNLPVVAAAAAAQVAPIRLILAERVELPAVPLRAQAAARFQPQLTPAQRLLRVLLLSPSRVAAVLVAQETTPVRVPLAVLAASPAAAVVVVVAVQPRAALVAQAARAA